MNPQCFVEVAITENAKIASCEDHRHSDHIMNHSMYSADRRTHLKIVAAGLLFAILVMAIGAFARIGDIDLGTAPLVKADRTTTLTGRLPAIR